MTPNLPAMPTVVKIRSAARGRKRVVVLSDGRELLVSEEAFQRVSFSEGQPAEPEFLQALEAVDRLVSVHDAALRLLSYRARSEAEMRVRLTQRGVAPPAIEEELDRLRNAGLLDDEAFARAWVEDRKRLAPRGRRMLRRELLGLGIAPESIELAAGDIDDRATAGQLARARARKIPSGDYGNFSVRIAGFLQRRGFDHEVAAEAARLAWAEVQADGAATDADGLATDG